MSGDSRLGPARRSHGLGGQVSESDLGREEAKSHTSTMPSSSGEYHQTQSTLMKRRRRLHCSKRTKIKEFVGFVGFFKFFKMWAFF